MKNLKILTIVAIATASFTACQKESLMQPAELNSSSVENAEKAVAKPYIRSIKDASGNAVQTFVYDTISQLTDIRNGNNLNQHFSYKPTGQLTNIEVKDNLGNTVKVINYYYTMAPDLPSSAQIFEIDNTGSLQLISEVMFSWNANGNKIQEKTTVIASGQTSIQQYTYLKGNITLYEYIEYGVVLGTRTFLLFDTAKNPFKNTPILKLIPGNEFQNNNALVVLTDRGGVTLKEKSTITYNGNATPNEITTTNNNGTSTRLFYSYIKM